MINNIINNISKACKVYLNSTQNFLRNFVDLIKEIDKPILKFMLKGFKFSSSVCIFSLLILIIYSTYPISHIGFQSSLILFKTGLMFAVSFFICGFVTDKLKKEMS